VDAAGWRVFVRSSFFSALIRRLFTHGRGKLNALLEIQEDYEESVRGYLETLVRCRRDMLRLTVVLGQRILP
jgi:hypothetical protein